MNALQRRRRFAPVVWLLVFGLALPPGAMTSAFAVTNRRIATFSRDSKLETFRNPQFSTAASNRFLFTQGPQALVGSGGDNFSNPDARGYGSIAEPAAHWISYKGRLEWTDNDLMVPGVGLPLIFQRIYRGSVGDYDGPLGKEWEFNWNKRIKYDTAGGTTRAWFYELGRREEYPYSGGAYSSPIGRYDNLTRTGTPEYIRTDREGIVETYAQEPADATWFRLKEIKDLSDNALTFSYDSNSLLTKVTDSLSRDTTLAFDGNDRITKITDSASREWVYGYTSGRLVSVTTPIVNETDDIDDFLAGKITTYLYDSAGLLTEIKRPLDSGGTGTWKWAYDGSGRITLETRAGNNLTLAYDDTNKKVTVTDREANKTIYHYDDGHEGNLITKRQVYWDASNSYESTFAYDAAGNVTSAVFPKGNRVLYTFDGSGNVLTVSFKKDADDAAPLKWIYSWASNARMSTLKDPNGNTWDYDYDGDGNLLTRTAPAVTLPNSTYGTIRDIWAYNASGQVTRHTNPVATVTDTSYSTVNSKSAYPTAVTRDSGGGKLNLITQYAYDSKGNVTSVTDPNGNATTYTVNALNQVIAAVEPLSVTRKVHYDPNDRVTKTEVSNDSTVGNSWFITDNDYDTQDNLTRVRADLTDSTRITTTNAFDKNDRLTSTTSPQGNETVTSWDVRDIVAAVTRKAASSADDAITTNVYDSNGNRVSVTNPRGYNTIVALDGYDRVTKVTQPEGNYVTSVLDGNGNAVTRSHYNAGATKLAETFYSFDQANRLYQTDTLAKKADLSTNLGDGVQTNTLHRDEAGRVLEHSGDVCGCSNYVHVYDAVGRQVTSKDPMGGDDASRNLVLSFYDKNGNLTKSTRKERTQSSGIEADKDITTEYVFDARNRRTTLKERLDVSTTMDSIYSYGLRDQLTKVVDGNGDEQRTEHNEQLWTTKDILENGSADVTTEYTFDSDGRVVTYVAKNSTTGDQHTLYTYDKLDRTVTTAWPVGGSHIQTYDKASNRISTTDPNGTLLVCAYDKNNRLTSRDMTLASNIVGADGHTFGYDGMDRMTAADTDENGAFSTSITMTWNTLGKKETEKQVIDGYDSGNGRTITYTYDVEGNKLSTTTPVGATVLSYTRDALDRVDKISRGSSEVIDYTWNGSRPIKSAYPGSHTTLLYDGYGRLTDSHAKDTSSGNSLARFTYLFDGSSQITAMDTYYYDDVQNTRITGTSLDEGDQYKYDGAKRLVTVLRGVATANITNSVSANMAANPVAYRAFVDYKLDQTGNRTTRMLDGSNDVVYGHDMANEMTTEGGSTHTYNNNGAFTGTSNAYRYTWNDQFGTYIKAGSPAVTHTWHYDALGRRVQINDSSNPTRILRHYYDGDQMVEVNTWNGSTESAVKAFVFGDRIDDLVLYVDTYASLSFYAHKDHLGSVAVLVNGNGVIKEGYRYYEYGATTIVDHTFAKLTTTLTSPVGNPHRYTGREEHNSVGSYGDDWYYYRAREYRPEAGRFVQRDAAMDSQYLRAYIYARNAPPLFSDPWGLVPAGTDGGGGGKPKSPGGNVLSNCDEPTQEALKDALSGMSGNPSKDKVFINCDCRDWDSSSKKCAETFSANYGDSGGTDAAFMKKNLPDELENKGYALICLSPAAKPDPADPCKKLACGDSPGPNTMFSFPFMIAHELGHLACFKQFPSLQDDPKSKEWCATEWASGYDPAENGNDKKAKKNANQCNEDNSWDKPPDPDKKQP